MKEGDKVDIIIGKETPLGYVVLINEEYEGLLYKSEVYKTVIVGQRTIGYIKKIREDDKIDVSLNPQGFKNIIDTLTDTIWRELEDNNGVLHISDKSAPEVIKKRLQMSKKNFKKAIGKLYKEKKITITDDAIYLVKKKRDS